MKPGLEVGKSFSKRFEIDTDRTIGFMGDALRVYASPSMTRDMENTCREFLQEFLEEGENSVGARIELDHMGPTLIGMHVEVTATVTEVDGRKVAFSFEVSDEIEQVGRGRHVRFVVALDRQKERLESKAAKMKDKSES
jgi:fluoroacetyl-CoA thioesterase